MDSSQAESLPLSLSKHPEVGWEEGWEEGKSTLVWLMNPDSSPLFMWPR